MKMSSVFYILFFINSCSAADNAIMHMMRERTPAYAVFMVKGNKKSRRPVILLRIVCDENIFLLTSIFKIFIIKIKTIHMSLMGWKCRIGNNFIKHTDINIKSASESNCAPNRFAESVFRATVPSIISVKPHRIYTV